MLNKTKQNIFYLLIMCGVICLYSCTPINYFKNIESPYLEKLLNPEVMYSELVVPLNHDRVVILDVASLWMVYDNYYQLKYATYLSFLTDLYKGRIKNIDKHFLSYDIHIIDKEIMREYQQNGLSFIIEKYLSKDEILYYDLMNNKFNAAIVAIMFINEYLILYDEMRPLYSFEKELRKIPSLDGNI
ncbi:MAG: hypothetical protein LUH22_14700 [Bacteroides sp.]|nr:hypothetical protein [Bacteroides sp.]